LGVAGVEGVAGATATWQRLLQELRDNFGEGGEGRAALSDEQRAELPAVEARLSQLASQAQALDQALAAGEAAAVTGEGDESEDATRRRSFLLYGSEGLSRCSSKV